MTVFGYHYFLFGGGGGEGGNFYLHPNPHKFALKISKNH